MLVNSISASSVEEISSDMMTIITYMYYRFASHLYTCTICTHVLYKVHTIVPALYIYIAHCMHNIIHVGLDLLRSLSEFSQRRLQLQQTDTSHGQEENGSCKAFRYYYLCH